MPGEGLADHMAGEAPGESQGLTPHLQLPCRGMPVERLIAVIPCPDLGDKQGQLRRQQVPDLPVGHPDGNGLLHHRLQGHRLTLPFPFAEPPRGIHQVEGAAAGMDTSRTLR